MEAADRAPAHGTRDYQDRGWRRHRVDPSGRERARSGVPLVVRRQGGRQGVSAFHQGSTAITTIAFTAVDDDTVAYTLREDGKITATGTTTAVSKDGKELRVTTKSVNGTGAGNTEIYDRLP